MVLKITIVLDPQSRRRLHNSQMAQEQIGMFQVLSIDFCPKESHVATFVDPYSFPILYHPNCNNLVKEHMQSLAQKAGPFILIFHLRR